MITIGVRVFGIFVLLLMSVCVDKYLREGNGGFVSEEGLQVIMPRIHPVPGLVVMFFGLVLAYSSLASIVAHYLFKTFGV